MRLWAGGGVPAGQGLEGPLGTLEFVLRSPNLPPPRRQKAVLQPLVLGESLGTPLGEKRTLPGTQLGP